MPATVLDIHSPINDSTLPVGSPYILDYVIINSKPGDYLKVQVDSHKPETVIGQKGQHYMRGLTAGKHLVKITAYRNKSATGGQAIITIHAQ